MSKRCWVQRKHLGCRVVCLALFFFILDVYASFIIISKSFLPVSMIENAFGEFLFYILVIYKPYLSLYQQWDINISNRYALTWKQYKIVYTYTARKETTIQMSLKANCECGYNAHEDTQAPSCHFLSFPVMRLL